MSVYRTIGPLVLSNFAIFTHLPTCLPYTHTHTHTHTHTFKVLYFNLYFQNELHTKYPEGIEDGKIAVVGGGKLQCEKIYFVSLPENEDSSCDDTEVGSSM